LPVSASDLGAYRRIQSVKRSFGSREPVSLLVCTRTLVLKIKVERPVWIVLEWHPTADGEPVQAVADLKTLLII
jgi:hypothetical protein